MNANRHSFPREPHSPADDEPTVMGMEERSAWIQIFVFAITTGAYLAVVIPRVRTQPIDEVEWVVPLLWCMGLSIVSVIVGSIIAGIGGAIGLTMRGLNPNSEFATDSRDKDISRHARRRTRWAATVIAVGVLVLAMIDADTFWIGSFVYVISTIAAISEAVVKIRAYRRGFVE
jgi:hypothetical protein